MRRLVLTRGHQGTGKTTFLRQFGLGGYRLSADDLRQLYASPVMTPHGRMGASHEQEKRVWSTLFEILDERMARGELVCVDATHRAAKDFKRYLELAERHRYRIACVDFTRIPLEEALLSNERRDSYAVVPESVVRRTYEACLAGEVPAGVHVIPWRASRGHIDDLRVWLNEPIRDLSQWQRVVCVGDLQGCFTPLREYLGDVGLRDDSFYVFVGDLCDRGPENDAVVRFAMDAIQRPNVAILWGNHETHLHRWAKGIPGRSEEFAERTRPQLEAAGITAGDVDALCDQLLDCLLFQWHDERVLVTHAGMPTVPKHPERIATRQYSHGTGAYADPIDARLAEHAPADWTQIHGHRNVLHLPPLAAPRSYNLEGEVEHGGQLRTVELDARGFTVVEIDNRVFKPLVERVRDKTARNTRAQPDWLAPEPPRLRPEQLAALRDHPLVRERPSASRPHLSSFNFTRDAFIEAAWDDLTTRARGLFVNPGTGEVVARAYDKFFNVGERPETTEAALERDLVFPVDAWLKENGYLGILGYDAVRDDLLFASKASPDNEFAGWFEAAARATWSAATLERVRRFLRDAHASMVFEVVDPERDPHIIEYDAPRLILLDVIHRSLDFARLPYDRLQRLCKSFGLEPKRRAARLRDFGAFSGWLRAVRAPDYRYEGAHVEGFVLEDQRGFLTKLKLDYYAFWKRMRGLKQRIATTRASGRPLGRDLTDPRARAFHDWCVQQPDEVLGAGIVTLRRSFLAGDVPTGYAPAPPPPPKALTGFTRALDTLSDAPELKPATADGLLARALEDDAKMDHLRAHEIRFRLVRAATPGPERHAAAEALAIDLD